MKNFKWADYDKLRQNMPYSILICNKKMSGLRSW
jgi:hypothetical protein